MNNRRAICLILLICAAAVAGSCSNKPGNVDEKKVSGGARKATGAAPAAGDNGAVPAVAQAPAVKAAPTLVISRTPEKLLAALPCKFDNKEGVFAAFPDNPIAGQQCFGLFMASPETKNGVGQFDIQGGGLAFVFHGPTKVAPGAVKIVNWRLRGGTPCFDADCGTELAAKVEILKDSKNPGWTFTVVTPKDTINLAADYGGFFGLVDKGGGPEARYLPVFK